MLLVYGVQLLLAGVEGGKPRLFRLAYGYRAGDREPGRLAQEGKKTRLNATVGAGE